MTEILIFLLGILISATFCSASSIFKKEQRDYQNYRNNNRDFFDEE
jgi:hypothetical protein